MPLFPELPVLESVAGASRDRLNGEWVDTGLVCCQHLLETTGALFERLIQLGFSPNSIFVMGKVYSTNAGVARRLKRLGCHVMPGSPAPRPGAHQMALESDAETLWRDAIAAFRKDGVKRVVVLDDGGVMHFNMPSSVAHEFAVVGIEQTTFGMAHNTQIGMGGVPVINVASSAAKRHFEPPLIADAVLRRVTGIVNSFDVRPVCGVLGLGKIGLSVVQSLETENCEVIAHDRNGQRLELLRRRRQRVTKVELLSRARVVFGCCGADTLTKEDVHGVAKGTRILASCSSGDVEFRSVLLADVKWRRSRKGPRASPDLQCAFGFPELRVQVLRSGYPVNFDNTPESVPAMEIQLTRGLLLAAILQARTLLLSGARKRCGSIMLDPRMQHLVVQTWRKHTRRAVGREHDIEWFAIESQGSQVNL
jgi:S-adenosylhomocysteine hydrolase